MIGWRGLSVFLLAGVVTCAVPALAQDKAEPGPRAAVNGAYRRPLGGDPATLDPVRTNDIYGRAVTQQIFDGLVQFDQTLTLGPALAHYWRAARERVRRSFTARQRGDVH